MTKRKASSELEESPSKRRTRSNAAHVDSDTIVVRTKLKRRPPPKDRSNTPVVLLHKPPVTKRYGRSKRPSLTVPSSDKSDSGQEEEEDEGQDDELLLSPRKSTRVGHASSPTESPRRMVMESVEIPTPSKSSTPVRVLKPKTRNQSSPTTSQTRTSTGNRRAKGSGGDGSLADGASPRTLDKGRTPSPTPMVTRSSRKTQSSRTNGTAQEQSVSVANATPSRRNNSPEKTASPSKKTNAALPRTLSAALHKCLNAQKRAVLAAFNDIPSFDITNDLDDDTEPPANNIALHQLTELLKGSVERGEGNSCLIIGPKGSGKTRICNQALLDVSTRPITIRLSGHVQYNDRLAMREIARQVSIQANESLSAAFGNDEDPFAGKPGEHAENDDGDDLNTVLPPTSHLPSLISSLSSLSRPVVILIDAFDLFTGHARQALLYCLLDAVQSCRTGGEGNRGIAVVGLTSRVDVVNLLEKRVKSRFSHRILRTAGMRRVEDWSMLLRECLCTPAGDRHDEPPSNDDNDEQGKWQELWHRSVDKFLNERPFSDILKDIFSLTRDLRVLIRIMTGAILDLTANSPFLSANTVQPHAIAHRNSQYTHVLSTLSYPSICLLIAVQHVRTSGHDAFTFEMLHELFRDQVRTSAAAPVTIGGGGIGMMNAGRAVLMGAFEQLVCIRIFRPVSSPTAGLAGEFIKHRCIIERQELKAAVERLGQTTLKKWLNKAQ